MRLLKRAPKRRGIRQARLQIRLEHRRVNGVGVAEQKQAGAGAQGRHEGRTLRGMPVKMQHQASWIWSEVVPGWQRLAKWP